MHFLLFLRRRAGVLCLLGPLRTSSLQVQGMRKEERGERRGGWKEKNLYIKHRSSDLLLQGDDRTWLSLVGQCSWDVPSINKVNLLYVKAHGSM